MRRVLPFSRRKTARRGSDVAHLRLAALAGFFVGLVSVFYPVSSPADASRPGIARVSQCFAVDGDTLRCGAERIRLVGIDSPEMPGHCREGRQCVAGDPFAARASLRAGLDGPLRIERHGEDAYGRTLALVGGREGDLSCRQLRRGHAVYRADWDEGGRLRARCPRSP